MNAGDAMTAKGLMTKRKRGEGTNHNLDRKETRGTGHVLDKTKNLPDQRPKFTSFTPLVMLIKKILMQIKEEPSLQWPRPIYAPAEVSDKSKYYKFH